jgi:hypothetical protein
LQSGWVLLLTVVAGNLWQCGYSLLFPSLLGRWMFEVI